jgi:MFS family permease
MNRDLIFVALALFTWGVGEGTFFFFQPLYLEHLGASHLGIGGILGAVGLVMTLAHLPAGYLADRIGRRPLLRAAWLMGTASAWMMALAPGLSFFTVGVLAYAVTAFVISPLNSYITAARGKLSVGRVLTLLGACFNLGAILGPLLGGLIADYAGLRFIYLFAAVAFCISTVFIFSIGRQPVEAPPDLNTKQTLHVSPRHAAYLGIIFLAMFATYLPQPLSPNFLQNEHSLAFSQVGQLGAISSVGVVFFNLILGHFDARLGFLLGQVSVGVFSFFLWQGTGMPWFVPAYFLLGGYRTARALATAQTRAYVHASNMGFAYGLTETTCASGMILAPPLAGYLYEANPLLIYQVSLGLIIISSIGGALFLFSRKKADPTIPVRIDQSIT